jgi:pilus assembly protein CpaC
MASAWLALSAGLLSSGQALAADRRGSDDLFVSEGPEPKRITVIVNKSRTFSVGRPFARAIVGSVDYADVLPLSDRAIYIQGKRPGTTNVSLFDGDARLIGVLDLVVALDAGSLQEKIRGTSAGTQGIRVSSTQGQVVLTGTAVDAVAVERAMSVAKSLAGDQPVVNAMQVAPSQQVMLEVRFLEVSRNAGRELGVNWQANIGGKQLINTGTGSARNPQADTTTTTTTVGGVTTSSTTTNTGLQVPVVSAVGTLIGQSAAGPFGTVLANIFNRGGTSIDVLVTALEEKGVVRRLAEPNLIALSGDEARFLAGGEFPVPVASDTTTLVRTVTIEFKKFGVQLKFRPIVLARGIINLKIEPEVSELDFANSVTIAGTTVPALTTRNLTTTVELRDGQSFALAGLLSAVNSNNLQQVPWLGSVPVLGALFRSASYQTKETDLVIIVTPRLVGPVVPGQKIASPLDSRLPPNDVDFFLMGQPELKKEYSDYIGRGGELKGPYGHIIQPELATPSTNKR